jgi:hypothetical protein
VPAAHATVTTTRPSRYLIQLCRHVDQLSRHISHPLHRRQGDPEHTPPGTHASATWSDTAGAIDLGWGRCTLTANDDTLVLHAEADDAADLQRLQALLGARLEQFGRRDHLTVTWQPDLTATLGSTATASSQDAPHAGRRGPHRRIVGLVVLGTLVVALHVALGAAMIAAPSWTTPVLDVALAVVILKLLISIVLGRRIVHQRRGSQAATSEPVEQPRP